MTDTRLLKAHMAMQGITPKDLAEAQGWKCTATAYRKINNKISFTVPEVQTCVSLLRLDVATANAIFFAPVLS